MTKLTVAFRNFAQAPKNQSINVVYGNNRCLFWDPQQSQKFTLLRELELFNFKMAAHKVGLITGPLKVNVPLKYFVCHCQIFYVPVFYKFLRDICIKSLIIAISMHNDSSMLHIQGIHKGMVRKTGCYPNWTPIMAITFYNWTVFPPIFTGMYECFSIVFFNSAGSDVLQKETTTFSLGHSVRRI